MDQESIIRFFENAGLSLKNNPADGAPLRDLAVSLVDEVYEIEDSSTRFVVFFVCNFVEDFFYNLTGDIASNETVRKAQHDLLLISGGALLELASLMRKGELANSQPVLAGLVVKYTGLIPEVEFALKDIHYDEEPI